LPIEEIGIPLYRVKPARSDNDLEKKNIIYPYPIRFLFTFSLSLDGERDDYIPIEPWNVQDLGKIIDDVEEKLLNIATELSDAPTDDEKRDAIL
jgi:hypothetical protein